MRLIAREYGTEAKFHRGEIVTLPDAGHAGRRDQQALAFERLEDADLSRDRLFDGIPTTACQENGAARLPVNNGPADGIRLWEG
jgi:hypothetical protein